MFVSAPRDTFDGVGTGRKTGSEVGEAIRWGHFFFRRTRLICQPPSGHKSWVVCLDFSGVWWDAADRSPARYIFELQGGSAERPAFHLDVPLHVPTHLGTITVESQRETARAWSQK